MMDHHEQEHLDHLRSRVRLCWLMLGTAIRQRNGRDEIHAEEKLRLAREAFVTARRNADVSRFTFQRV